MAKKKALQRKAAAPRARARAPAAAAPARRRPARRKSNVALKNGVAALVGGASGALAGGLLVKAGVKPTTAAVGVTVAGAVGTLTLTGTSRAVSAGVASAGAGQLALGWLATVRNSEMPAAQFRQELPSAREVDQIDAIDVDDMFRQARNEFQYDDEDDDVFVDMEAA